MKNSNIKPIKRISRKKIIIENDAENEKSSNSVLMKNINPDRNDLKNKLTAGNEEINVNLEDLVLNALNQWKKEFESETVRTDSVGDLEKLIKLKLLIKDESQMIKDIVDKLVDRFIEIIRLTIEDSDKRIAILEKLKEIDYKEFE